MALGFLMILVGVSQAAPMFVDNYLHPNDVNDWQRTVDVIGSNPPFQIYGYDILNSGSLVRIYTDWDKGLSGMGPLQARLGDVFIYTPQGTYGVAVRDHGFTAANGNYIDEGNLKQGDVFKATSFLKSDYYYDKNFGLVQKAEYYQYGDNEIVVANAGEIIGKAAVSLFWGGIGNSYIDIAFDQAYFGPTLYLSFAQTCANDVMKVPEPGMLILLGSGILGLGIVARRRKP